MENRTRYQTFEQALEAVDGMDSPMLSIRHIMLNPEDDYSFMAHINCEWCRYCDEGLYISSATHNVSGPHAFLEDPYGESDC